MNIVFWGSSSASTAIAEAIAEEHTLVLVVTQPDRTKGRGQRLLPTPVKQFSEKRGIPVITPEDPNTEQVVRTISESDPELFFLCAYAKILGKELLAIPQKGAVNLHFSLLPALRGAAPVRRAIMEGFHETGVTTFFMNEYLDRGDIILQETTEVKEFETAGDLEARLVTMGIALAKETIERIHKGNLSLMKQDQSKKSYAKKIAKEECIVNWEAPAAKVVRQINGLSPTPGSYTFFRGKRLVLLKASLGNEEKVAPGSILADEQLRAGAGDGIAVIIHSVKPEGKKQMGSRDFINGFRIADGETFQSTSW
jgi:methionyl-tRNA formyltransferase